jgi:hypothetical protein
MREPCSHHLLRGGSLVGSGIPASLRNLLVHFHPNALQPYRLSRYPNARPLSGVRHGVDGMAGGRGGRPSFPTTMRCRPTPAAGTVVAVASGTAGRGTRRAARMSALFRGIRPALGPLAPRRDLAGNGSVPQGTARVAGNGSVPQGTAHVAGNGYAPRALNVQAGDRTSRLLTIGLVDASSGGGYDGGESGD